MKTHRIITTNKEVYEKLNMLNFSSEVLIKSDKNLKLSKILNNVNKRGNVVSYEKVGDYTLVKKVNPVSLNIYLNGGDNQWRAKQKVKRKNPRNNLLDLI
jgi:hypothetical protein